MARKTTIGNLIRKWHKDTDPSARTIENLLVYLQAKKLDLKKLYEAFEKALGLAHNERAYLAGAAMIPVRFGLDFRLTPLVVDAIIGPRRSMVEYEQRSYEYFLRWYQEHPFLENLIKKSAGNLPGLRIIPVVCTDNLIAWLYDPCDERVYQFLKTERNAKIGVTTRKKVVIESISPSTTCQLYTRKNHPFSARYRERSRRLKKAFA